VREDEIDGMDQERGAVRLERVRARGWASSSRAVHSGPCSQKCP
jgi:hypothetical protein